MLTRARTPMHARFHAWIRACACMRVHARACVLVRARAQVYGVYYFIIIINILVILFSHLYV